MHTPKYPLLSTVEYANPLVADEDRFQQFTHLVDRCLTLGVSFDRFFVNYIDLNGKYLFWNPFWRHGDSYTPAKIFHLLRARGYGSVPEAAVNVFWQVRAEELHVMH